MSKLPDVRSARLRTIAIYTGILLLIAGLAVFLRLVFREADVFGAGWVRFAETDPWYHLRLIENLLHHFPQNITFDPYTFFPNGRDVFFAPLFDLIVGGVAWIAGLGSPSQHTLEVIAAYFPVVMGVLIIVPVFFIAKELFNKQVGLISAALIMILPGDFFARTLLGVTDHHVAEIFFSTLAVLFLILAVKDARAKDITFQNLRHGNWKILRKTLIYALLFGLMLGVYMLTWVGGLLVLLIFFVFFIIQFIIDHLRGRSADYLCIIGVPSFLLALIMVIPFIGEGSLDKLQPLSLALGMAAFVVLALLSLRMAGRKIHRGFYPAALAAIGIIGILVVFFGARSIFDAVIRDFKIFLPQGGALTITEVQPLFYGFSFSNFTHTRAWGFFTTGFFYVPVALVLLIYSAVKKTEAERTFFLIWSLMMLLATIGQNRFSYYLAINVAMCGGYICWKIFEWLRALMKLTGIERSRQSAPVAVQTRTKKKGYKQPQPVIKSSGRYPVPYYSLVLAVLICFFLVFFPNYSQAKAVADTVPAPDNDWHSTLLWMKDNTPEPFGNPDYYYERYSRPAPGKGFDYPASAYGVMSWWDYGHWITEIAHRIPDSNAFQDGATTAANYLTAQDETEGNKYLDRLRSKYVVIDRAMATTKIAAIVNWTGRKVLAEYFYQPNSNGVYERVLVYYPEYYRSMCIRLYNFGGLAVVPSNTTRVLTYVDRVDTRGVNYKEITANKVYATYEEALAVVSKTPNTLIGGTEPFVCPVPLEKLQHYQLVYQSPTVLGQEGNRKVTYVEVFEYKP
jgi:dolichyl-phosphooligosaccharide-protein glycotransferase